MKYKKITELVVLAVVSSIVVGFLAVFFMKYLHQEVYVTDEKAIDNKPHASGYAIEERDTNNDLTWDAQLVWFESNGNKTILVESIREAIPELQSRPNWALAKYSFPENSSYLFFKKLLWGSDLPVYEIYSFNLESNIFNKLKTSSQYFAGAYLSPDGSRLVSTQDRAYKNEDKTIYLVDLETDQVRTLVQLESNESLWGETNTLTGEPISRLKWIDDTTISYEVYDVSKPLVFGEPRTLLETRIVKVQ